MHSLISSFLENWTSFYSNHAVIRTFIAFFHVGGLLLAGGCAIAADRSILLARKRNTAERSRQVEALRGTHRIVLISLGIVIASGLLLFAADSDNFLHSVFFWVKMGLFAALMVNGFLVVRAERRAETDILSAWRTLTITSTISVALWMLTTLAGAALPNIG
jgi:hypothetical protein